MAFDAPTFAGIDFGFANTASDAFMSICRGVYPGAARQRKQVIMFSGADGAWVKGLGLGPRQVGWRILSFFKTCAAQIALERAWNEKLAFLAWTMTFHGRSYDQVKLSEWMPVGEVLPCMQTWSFGQEYLLLFDVLNWSGQE